MSDATSSAALTAALRDFESRADKDNPEHVRALEEMRSHVRRLQQLRGDWDRETGDRDWNRPVPVAEGKALPPSKDNSYRAYKEHKRQASAGLGGLPARLLTGGGSQG